MGVPRECCSERDEEPTVGRLRDRYARRATQLSKPGESPIAAFVSRSPALSLTGDPDGACEMYLCAGYSIRQLEFEFEWVLGIHDELLKACDVGASRDLRHDHGSILDLFLTQ